MRKSIFILGGFCVMRLAAQDVSADKPRDTAEIKRKFEVRYVATDAVYISGGREAGLAEGYRLKVRRLKPGDAEMAAVDVADITIISVASNSAACEIKSKLMPIQVGDIAYVSAEDLETMKVMKVSQDVRKYAQVVSFTDGDPLDEEVRKYIPRPQSPAVNRVRGMVSFEYNAIDDHDSQTLTSQEGMLVRADMTRIGGSFWNFTGYWRGRFTSYSGSANLATIDDLLNRTYHIGLYYNNPDSKYTMGVGRLLIPWATSLNTIDGGYLARRLSKHFTAGIFGGSTPDPTAWNYNPNRQIAGLFDYFEAGSFDGWRVTSTQGAALTRIHWNAERQFAFFENNLSWKRYLSVYNDVEVDDYVPGRFGNTESGIKPSRSFLTVRVQPRSFLTLEANDNYFRTVPTFDLLLLGTGLLDKYLFRGWSGGAHLDLPKHISLYGSIGTSSRDTDPQPSRNLMYGVTVGHLWGSIRGDYRHTEFSSSFGKGGYDAVTFTREFSDTLRFEFQAGKQDLHAIISSQHQTYFLNSNFDWFFSRHYSAGGGWNLYRGGTQNYDQIFSRFGYRF
jgi:hypothetical protein